MVVIKSNWNLNERNSNQTLVMGYLLHLIIKNQNKLVYANKHKLSQHQVFEENKKINLYGYI